MLRILVEFTYVCLINYVSCCDIASKMGLVVPAFVSFISLNQEQEMVRTYVTHGNGVHSGFLGGYLKERDHVKDLGINGRIMYLK